jgi:serine/threonine protein kinase
MYNMLTGNNLFSSSRVFTTLKKNRRCDFSHLNEDLKMCSYEALDFIKQLLKRNPDERPSAEEALTHPWFSEKKLQIRYLLKCNKNLASPCLKPILTQS